MTGSHKNCLIFVSSTFTSIISPVYDMKINLVEQLACEDKSARVLTVDFINEKKYHEASGKF